jgi:hypothetical protein
MLSKREARRAAKAAGAVRERWLRRAPLRLDDGDRGEVEVSLVVVREVDFVVISYYSNKKGKVAKRREA